MELLLGTDIPLYLLLLPLTCLLFYIYGTWPYGVWKSLGIDGPKPSPFIGNQYEMNTKMETHINRCSTDLTENIREALRKADRVDVKNKSYFEYRFVQQKETDFLQIIVSCEETVGSTEKRIKSLTRVEVIAQAVVFFVAGYETTSTALQFLAYHLARYPEVQEKVVEEIKRQIGDEIPTYEGMAKLKYLDCVISETLRMFPPLNIVNRMASETITIKGVTIPKGSGVAVPIANVLRDPEYFPEPDQFKPERFSDDNGLSSPASFLAFGYGPRQCIGMRLAVLQIKMAMVHVLRNVKFVQTADLQEAPARKYGTFLSPLERPLFLTAELRQ